MKIEVLEMEGGVVVIRARSSELFIMPQYVAELKKLDKGPEFVSYFMSQALVNRTARQMFKACLRKDSGLWRKIYDAVQHIEVPSMESEDNKDTKDKTKTESDGMLGFPKAEMTRGAKEADDNKKAKKASVTKVEADDDDVDEEDEDEEVEDVDIEEDDVDSSDDFSDDKELVAQTKAKKATSTKKTVAKTAAKSTKTTKTAKTAKTTKAAATKTAAKKTTTAKASSTAKKTTVKKAEGTKSAKTATASKTKKTTSTKKSK